MESPRNSKIVKDETYLMIERMLETMNNATVISQVKLETCVDLLNADLSRGENVLSIFNIFNILLKKVQEGVFPDVSNFGKSITLLLNRLIKSMMDPDSNEEIYDICLKVLTKFPNKYYSEQCKKVLEVLSIRFNLENVNKFDINQYQKFLTFYDVFLMNISEADKIKFVKEGIPLWLTKMIPFMFLPDNPNRFFGIEICKSILDILVTLDYFQSPHWGDIVKNTKDSAGYSKVMLDLLHKNNPIWEKLWIFLIRILGIELHKIGASINPILFVVQEAFKNTAEFKIQAFRCLKELIDNFSLDVNVLHHSKRIQVLAAAFESNNAKVKEIALVKFNTWWYFISKLHPNLMNHDKVFKSFLKFCFGDLSNGSAEGKKNSICPGSMFPPVQKLAIKSFVEICGHYQCKGCTKNAVFQLQEPLLKSDSIMDKYYTSLISALRQVTIYVHSQLQNPDKALFEENIQNLKCIWGSFVSTAATVKCKKTHEAVLRALFTTVVNLVENHAKDPLFAEIILTIVIPSVVQKNAYTTEQLNDESLKILNLYPPIRALLVLIKLPSLYHHETMSKVHFDFDRLMDIGLEHDMSSFSLWLTSNLKPIGHGPLLWCSLSNCLVDQSNPIMLNVLISVLTWPINNIKLNAKLSDIVASWKKLYNIPKIKIKQSAKKSPMVLEEEILSVLQKTNGNSLDDLSTYLLPIFIKKIVDEKPGCVLMIKKPLSMLKNNLNTLESGNLSEIHVRGLVTSLKELTSVLEQCHTYNVPLISVENVIDVIISTINILIMYHNDLCKQANFTEDTKPLYVNILIDTLNCLQIPSYFIKIASEIIVLIISVMKAVKLQSVEKKCLDSLNLLLKGDRKVKLENSEIIKIKQALDSVKAVNMEIVKKANESKNKKEENSEFFVPKTTWKFDPNNLTDKQKESLKRRRDDIPALYEDLSQSQDENSLQTWKPPNYQSDSQADSTKSSDKSNLVNNNDLDVNGKSKNLVPNMTKRIANMLNECGGDKMPLLEVKTQTVSPVIESEPLKHKGRTAQMIDMCKSEHCKENFVEKPEETFKSPNRRKGSILSRLDEKLKNLKHSDQNSIENVKIQDPLPSEIIKENNDKHVEDIKDVQIETMEVDNVIDNKLDDNETQTQEEATKLDDTKLNDETNPDLVSQDEKCSNDVINDMVVEITTSQMENIESIKIDSQSSDDSQSKEGPKRPVRIRRRPSKLLESPVENVPVKKLRGRRNTVTGVSNEKVSQCETPKNDNLLNSLTSTLPGKKQCRLLNQLQIKTNEGHPLMLSNGSKTRSTRRMTINTDEPNIFIEALKDVDPEKFSKIKSKVNKKDEVKDDTLNELKVDQSKSSSESSESSKTDSETFDSQDCIESSQEDTMLLKAIAKNRGSTLSEKIDSVKEVTVEANEEQIDNDKSVQIETEQIVEKVIETPTIPIINASLTTQELAEADTEPFIESLNKTNISVVDNDVSNVTDCELLFNTSIVSSPCIEANKTIEFLNNTMDISPIKVVSVTPELMTENESDKSPVKIKETTKDVTSPDLFTNDKISPTKEINVVKEVSPPKKNDWPLMVGSRTAQMLNICLKEGAQNEIKEKDEKVVSVPALKFSKLAPSTSASPVRSIFKRKLEPDASPFTVSPSSKKKRVSFHDPPVSTTVSVEKYIEDLSKESNQNLNILRRFKVAKCLENKMAMQLEKENEKKDEESLPLVTDSQLSENCSLSIESPAPLEIVTNHLLNDTDPIFPCLIDCTDSISKISVDLSSPLWNDKLLEELKDTVVTIGDLAKMTELEVNRLPIKTPKLTTVKTVLGNYFARMDYFSRRSVAEMSESVAEEVEALSDSQFKSTMCDSTANNVIDESDKEVTAVEVIQNEENFDEDKVEQREEINMEVEPVITEIENGDKIEEINHEAVLNNVPNDILIKYIEDKIKSDEIFKVNVSNVFKSMFKNDFNDFQSRLLAVKENIDFVLNSINNLTD